MANVIIISVCEGTLTHSRRANHNPLDPLHAHRQIPAITYALATAPDIQEDLKRLSSFFTEPYETFGLEDSVFGLKELEGYKMNNSLEDIAEDLDLEERYDLINDQPKNSVSMAFRGYNGKDFPEHQFDGLLGKVTNDYIENIRERVGGLDSWKRGVGVHAQTPEEMSENSRKAYANGLGNLTPEELSENGRKGALARGQHVWSLEEIVDIDELKYGEGLTWNDTTSEMNEKYDKNWRTVQVRKAYHNNKDKLPDEEE